MNVCMYVRTMGDQVHNNNDDYGGGDGDDDGDNNMYVCMYVCMYVRVCGLRQKYIKLHMFH